MKYWYFLIMFFLRSFLHIYNPVEGSFCSFTAWQRYTSFLDIPGFLHSSEQTKHHTLHLQNREMILTFCSVSTETGACYMRSGPSTFVELQWPPPFWPHFRHQTGIICMWYPVNGKKRSFYRCSTQAFPGGITHLYWDLQLLTWARILC